MRAWYIGCALRFQRSEPGSSPGARAISQHSSKEGHLPFKQGNRGSNPLCCAKITAGSFSGRTRAFEAQHESSILSPASKNKRDASGEGAALIRPLAKIDTWLRDHADDARWQRAVRL